MRKDNLTMRMGHYAMRRVLQYLYSQFWNESPHNVYYAEAIGKCTDMITEEFEGVGVLNVDWKGWVYRGK